jgi:hypothetical protein
MPIERADPDTRPLGDGLEAYLCPEIGEGFPADLEQVLSIALAVGA